jgi:hypothetical protein
LTKSRGSLLQSRARPDFRRDSLTWRAQCVSAAANSMRLSTASPEVFLPDSASGIWPGFRRFERVKAVRSTCSGSYSAPDSAVLLREESLSESLERSSGLLFGPCGDCFGEMQEVRRSCEDDKSSLCSLQCTKHNKRACSNTHVLNIENEIRDSKRRQLPNLKKRTSKGGNEKGGLYTYKTPETKKTDYTRRKHLNRKRRLIHI